MMTTVRPDNPIAEQRARRSAPRRTTCAAPCVLAAALLVATVGLVQAQDNGAAQQHSTSRAASLQTLINAALDEPIEELTIEDQPLLKALATIEEASGVPLAISDATLRLMPYGVDTRVNLSITGLPLRSGLDQLLGTLGLRYEVTPRVVQLRPNALLERIGRRLTPDEVDLLSQLSQESWSELGHRLNVRYEVRNSTDPQAALDKALERVERGVASRTLEAATRILSWTYTLEDGVVVFRSLRDDVEQRLDREVSISFRRKPIADTLVELGQMVGVTVSFEPGALATVETRDREVDFIHDRITVRQAFERICGVTALEYRVLPEGVKIASVARREGRPVARASRLVNITVELDGEPVRVIMRSDELPAALQSRLDLLVDEKIRELMESTD